VCVCVREKEINACGLINISAVDKNNLSDVDHYIRTFSNNS
jgi:hypothetical protein